MDTDGFINLLLISLCSNYQQELGNKTEFNCLLKTEEQLKRDVLRGKRLKILSFDDFPLNKVEELEGGTMKGAGITFELIDTLQEIYGFTYDLIKPPVRTVGDQTSGMLGMVAAGEVDMVAAFLPILPGTHEYIAWGTELHQNNYFIMMNRPHESASQSGLLAPFDTEVWLLTLLSLMVVGPIMYFIMWLRFRLCNDTTTSVFPLPSCIWFVYGALMKQGSTLNPLTDSSRILFATWWIFILILTAFYTANLTAFLTLSLFTLPIKTIEDVGLPPNHWFSTHGGSVEYSIANKDDGDLDILLPSVEKGRGQFVDTANQHTVLRLLSDGWLYMDDYSTLTRLMFQEYQKKTKLGIDENKRCTYVLTESFFLKRSLAFAYPKSSKLPALFNPVIQNFVESGILKHLTAEGLPITAICPLNLRSKERRLRNSDLATTYYVVLTGFSCALVIFFTEILRKKCTKMKPNYPKEVKHAHFDKNLKQSKIIGLSKYDSLKTQVQRSINGREYVMVTATDGDKRLIPLRTPSAFLFQYG